MASNEDIDEAMRLLEIANTYEQALREAEMLAERYKGLLITMAETMEKEKIMLRTANNIRRAVATLSKGKE